MSRHFFSGKEKHNDPSLRLGECYQIATECGYYLLHGICYILIYIIYPTFIDKEFRYSQRIRTSSNGTSTSSVYNETAQKYYHNNNHTKIPTERVSDRSVFNALTGVR